jgi:hypothetical protein
VKARAVGKGLNNRDIYIYALYRLQGAGQFVDVEDIYVECWRLSPSRFGWRKHDYPNYKTAAKAQQEIERAQPELLLKTADGLGRQLTDQGMTWVRDRLSDLQRLERGMTRAPAVRSVSHRSIVELEKHGPVRSFLAGQSIELSKIEVAQLLKCAPDSRASVWRERLATLRSAAADDERPDLIRFLDSIELIHPEWFGGMGADDGRRN